MKRPAASAPRSSSSGRTDDAGTDAIARRHRSSAEPRPKPTASGSSVPGFLKPPATPTSPEDPARHIEILREQLRRAVDAENFEAAAELRDRIKALE